MRCYLSYSQRGLDGESGVHLQGPRKEQYLSRLIGLWQRRQAAGPFNKRNIAGKAASGSISWSDVAQTLTTIASAVNEAAVDPAGAAKLAEGLTHGWRSDDVVLHGGRAENSRYASPPGDETVMQSSAQSLGATFVTGVTALDRPPWLSR